MTGPEYKHLYTDVGSNGKANDSGIWNKSSLLKGIQDVSVKLPDDEKLSNGEITPYVFLGDDAFALKRFMMEPFPQQGLTGERQVYNYRYSRVRMISGEYGEYFFTNINLKPKYVEDVILAALILHNMLIKSPKFS